MLAAETVQNFFLDEEVEKEERKRGRNIGGKRYKNPPANLP